MTETELDSTILSASQGDMPALEALYCEMKELVYAQALSITRQPSCAEDITQETFVRLSRPSGFRPRGQGRSWILRITRNLSLRQLKAQRTAQDKQSLSQTAVPPVLDGIEDKTLTRMLLKEALCTLGAAERQIVLLHAAGLKHEETARVLSRPAATVRWKYAQAIKKLSRYLSRMEEGNSNER